MSKRFTQVEKSWIKYDVANSAYTLTVSTVLFPILWKLVSIGVFSSNVQENNDISNQYFLWTTVFISLVVAFLSPILGAIADFKGYKMKLFKASLFIGLIFGFLLCIPGTPWYMLLGLYTIATIGYTSANVFYDAFLVDVTEEENYNRVSSAGFAWGYIGSCIPFILGMVVYGLVFLGILDNGYEKLTISIAFFISMVWWLIFSLPMLKDVKQQHYIEKPANWKKETFSRLWLTLKKISKQPKLLFYLIAYFLFIDAVYTIIKTAVTIGESFVDAAGNKLINSMDLLIVVFIVQVIAFPCAIIFGMLAKKLGEVKMLIYGIVVYLIICLMGYFLGDLINIKVDLYIFAALIGSAQGGLQAVSRSYFGKLIPKEESGEYYGLFNICGKFASVMGPGLMAITIYFFNTKAATLSLIPLLVLGLIFLLMSNLKKHDTLLSKDSNIA